MTAATLDEIERAWRQRDILERGNPVLIEFTTRLLTELAKGRPVTPARAAEILNDSTEQQAEDLFRQAARHGAEIDEKGALVGNILTLIPTPHRFRVNGIDLYAWCSLDTLFVPALIGEPAEVESICPVTGKVIRLTVGPEGIRSFAPPTARVSVVIPGVTPGCDMDSAPGPTSSTCTQMHFFITPRAAQTWAENHPEVAILTVTDAARIARILAEQPCRDCC